jgi:competence protein ComEC
VRLRSGAALLLACGVLALGVLALVGLSESHLPAPAPPAAPPAGESLAIHFLDVGQGDATLIEAPGGRWVLVDAGPGAGVVEELRRLGVDTLALFIASHNHADHIGGAVAVIEAFPVRFFMDNGVPHTTLTYRRMLEALAAADIPLLEPERRTVSLGEVALEILPPPEDPELGHNDNSIGVRIVWGEFAALLAGDAEEQLWRHWLSTRRELLTPVQVMKSSHHGSRNGDIPAALRRLRPRLVVISAGADNQYGHPHPQALERYAAAGAEVLITAEHGPITVLAGPDGSFRIRTTGTSLHDHPPAHP